MEWREEMRELGRLLSLALARLELARVALVVLAGPGADALGPVAAACAAFPLLIFLLFLLFFLRDEKFHSFATAGWTSTP